MTVVFDAGRTARPTSRTWPAAGCTTSVCPARDCPDLTALPASPAESAACCSPLSRPLREQAGQVAPLLKALADPVRLRLMSLVASRGRRRACAT